jgi:hypothetical protein
VAATSTGYQGTHTDDKTKATVATWKIARSAPKDQEKPRHSSFAWWRDTVQMCPVRPALLQSKQQPFPPDIALTYAAVRA